MFNFKLMGEKKDSNIVYTVKDYDFSFEQFFENVAPFCGLFVFAVIIYCIYDTITSIYYFLEKTSVKIGYIINKIYLKLKPYLKLKKGRELKAGRELSIRLLIELITFAVVVTIYNLCIFKYNLTHNLFYNLPVIILYIAYYVIFRPLDREFYMQLIANTMPRLTFVFLLFKLVGFRRLPVIFYLDILKFLIC